MGICWYCHWGWSRAVSDIYCRAFGDIEALDHEPPVDAFAALHFGPGHVVWEDENFGRRSIQGCLDDFEKYRNDDICPSLAAPIVRRSLEELLALPDNLRDPCPEGYDDEHPEDFPPQVKMADKGWWDHDRGPSERPR